MAERADAIALPRFHRAIEFQDVHFSYGGTDAVTLRGVTLTIRAGQTIAIVDAYGSSTLQSDLNTFCTAMGVPTTTLGIYYPQGKPSESRSKECEKLAEVMSKNYSIRCDYYHAELSYNRRKEVQDRWMKNEI